MSRCICGDDERTCHRQQRRDGGGAACERRRELRCVHCGEDPHRDVLCMTCEARENERDVGSVVLVYTNAPAAYDYWYTVEVQACAGIDTANKAWRCVRVPEDRIEAQSARYRSGWHAAMPPRDWNKALQFGVVRAGGAL